MTLQIKSGISSKNFWTAGGLAVSGPLVVEDQPGNEKLPAGEKPLVVEGRTADELSYN